MGILSGALAGLGEGVGTAAKMYGEYLSRSVLKEEEAAIQAKRDETLRRYKNEDTIAAEERGILNIPRVQNATMPGAIELKKAELSAANEAFMDRYKAQAEFDNDPTNVELRATAKAAEQKAVSLAAAEVSQELAKRPEYLADLEKLTLAAHPEKRAQIMASMSSAALSQFKLSQEKLVKAARGELAAATTPEERKAAKSKIEALEWSVATDRAQATADATVLSTLEKTIHNNRVTAQNTMTDEATRTRAKQVADNAQATYDALVKEYSKNRGLPDAPASKGGVQIGTGADAGKVMVDGVLIPGTAKTPAEVRALVAKYRATEERVSIEKPEPVEPTVKLPVGAPDPNDARLAARRGEAKAARDKEIAEKRAKWVREQEADAAVASGFKALTK